MVCPFEVGVRWRDSPHPIRLALRASAGSTSPRWGRWVSCFVFELWKGLLRAAGSDGAEGFAHGGDVGIGEEEPHHVAHPLERGERDDDDAGERVGARLALAVDVERRLLVEPHA